MKYLRDRALKLSITHLHLMQNYLDDKELRKLFFKHYKLVSYLNKKAN